MLVQPGHLLTLQRNQTQGQFLEKHQGSQHTHGVIFFLTQNWVPKTNEEQGSLLHLMKKQDQQLILKNVVLKQILAHSLLWFFFYSKA